MRLCSEKVPLRAIKCSDVATSSRPVSPLTADYWKLGEDIQRNYLSAFAQFLRSGPGHPLLAAARGRTQQTDDLKAAPPLCCDSQAQAAAIGCERSHCCFSLFEQREWKTL